MYFCLRVPLTLLELNKFFTDAKEKHGACGNHFMKGATHKVIITFQGLHMLHSHSQHCQFIQLA